jgi:hypothetical protein
MMRILRLSHDYKHEVTQLRGKHPDPQHVDRTIDGDCVAIAPTGSIQCVLLKERIPNHLHNPAYELWQTVDDDLSNRGSAVGARMLPEVKKDGSLGLRNRVPDEVLKILPSRQGVLGYAVGRDGKCYKTPLTVRRPELLDQNKTLIELVNSLYAKALPQMHARQWAEVATVACCRLWETVFTSGYIVRELRSAYHPGQRNLRGVFSAIMPFGSFTGGALILARWGLRIDYFPGDLLFFDPQLLHGNLPFEGSRLSAIFYCEKGIAACRDCEQ